MPCWLFSVIPFTCTFPQTIIAPIVLTGPRYGGIYERGSREYTLDDFHSLALDKMDRYVCLKKSDVVIPEGEIESSSDDDDEDDDEDDNDAEYEDDDDVAETLVDVDIHSLDNKEAKEDDDWSILETLEEEGPVTRIEVMKIAEDKPEDQVRKFYCPYFN